MSFSRLAATASVALGLLASNVAMAETRTICVYDPAGKSGDYYSLMSKYAAKASGWGVDVEIKAYTDEETAAKDYEAKQCDGVTATGVRLQRFNRFSSSIEAIGGLTDYGLLKQMVTTLATSKGAGAKLANEGNVTVGFVPVGAVYLFVNDKNIDTVAELAGKRIGTLDYDKASVFMVERVGAVVVPADLGSIGPKFNNGDVDAIYVSAAGYRPFELFRGLDKKGGGILKAPLAQATLQVMIREESFPDGFVDKSKAELLTQFSTAMAYIEKAEADIPSKYWVDIPGDTLKGWDELFQGVRVELKAKGTYDGGMLSVMKTLRCAKDGARSECAENKE